MNKQTSNTEENESITNKMSSFFKKKLQGANQTAKQQFMSVSQQSDIEQQLPGEPQKMATSSDGGV